MACFSSWQIVAVVACRFSDVTILYFCVDLLINEKIVIVCVCMFNMWSEGMLFISPIVVLFCLKQISQNVDFSQFRLV
jgi:hypothetical protein